MKLTLLPLQNDDVIRVRCEGLVSLRGLDRDSEPLQTLLGPHCASHKVLLNLDRAQGIDTSGIVWLIRAGDRFRQAGGVLVLFSLPPTVSDVLAFLRLTPLFRIAPGEAAALEMARDGRADLPGGKNFGPSLRLPG
jgi:anti-anti-sigma regulatory factor